jgi:toxin HigB-1
MIKSFADKEAERVWQRRRSKALPRWLQRAALRKLSQIHFAGELSDLRVPPGNRLEKLTGDRAGQHSIRINDHYRICFSWDEGDAYEVEILDYHRLRRRRR